MKVLSIIVLCLSIFTSCEEKIDSVTITINPLEPDPKQEIVEFKPKSNIYIFKLHFEYRGKEVTFEEIELLLQKLGKEERINIYVSNKAEHYSLVRLLKVMRKLDLKDFTISTLREKVESREPEDREGL